jgi:pimeloyl-ACP methyl ester carboxylesterase
LTDETGSLANDRLPLPTDTITFHSLKTSLSSVILTDETGSLANDRLPLPTDSSFCAGRSTLRLVVIPGGPHAINWTHADQINPLLLDFLQQE